MYCPYCGAIVDNDADFCQLCGKRVTQMESREEEGAPKPSPSSPSRQSSASPSQQSYKKAQEIGENAFEKSKKATGYAIQAIKILISDPLGGQGKAADLLGDAQGLQAGIVFSVAFVIASYLLDIHLYNQLSSLMGAGLLGTVIPEMTFGDHMQFIFLSVVPPLALAFSFLLIGKIFGGQANLNLSVFAAGVALLPTTITIALATLVGLGNFDLIGLFAVFGMCITVLLLNSAIVDIHKLSSQKSIFLTPLIILITVYIAKILYVRLLFAA